ncbi:helix-turn-helix domain-containing protein [Blastopirellula sediminis]|uniref:helix-turn-helix domain-containing protein n=1 Tax=Blastopirellula sediminis TaxID=2894196 RepID=UPI0036F21565
MSDFSDEAAQLLSIQELSDRSGVSVVTLRRWVKSGAISYFQPGGKNGRLLFPADAIQASASNLPASERPSPRAGRRPKWQS